MCSFKDDKFTIHNIICGRFEYPDLRKKIIQTAKDDGLGVVIAFEEAGQQLGFIDDLKRNEELRPYTIRADKPEGDKFNRTMPWASRAQLGNVNVCKARWNPDFFDECNSFTADDTHLHDDQIDALAMAVRLAGWDASSVAWAYGIWKCHHCGHGFGWQAGRPCPKCGTKAPAEYPNPELADSPQVGVLTDDQWAIVGLIDRGMSVPAGSDRSRTVDDVQRVAAWYIDGGQEAKAVLALDRARQLASGG